LQSHLDSRNLNSWVKVDFKRQLSSSVQIEEVKVDIETDQIIESEMRVKQPETIITFDSSGHR